MREIVVTDDMWAAACVAYGADTKHEHPMRAALRAALAAMPASEDYRAGWCAGRDAAATWVRTNANGIADASEYSRLLRTLSDVANDITRIEPPT